MNVKEGMIKSGEASKYLGLSQATLRTYQDKGMIQPDYTSPKGTRYFKMETIKAFESNYLLRRE